MTAGEQLGPYRIEAPIGEGGMGTVYRARDTRLDRTVALQVAKREFSERFEREARAVAAFNHPNICTLHDIGPNVIRWREYVDGASQRCWHGGAARGRVQRAVTLLPILQMRY